MSKKLELIKAAWIEIIGEIAYDEISKYMIDDGWCRYGSASDILFAEYRINMHRSIHFERERDMDRITKFRPRKIETILKNNGWIPLSKYSVDKITDTEILLCFKDRIISGPVKTSWIARMFESPFPAQGIPTHWKKYIPEEPPLY